MRRLAELWQKSERDRCEARRELSDVRVEIRTETNWQPKAQEMTIADWSETEGRRPVGNRQPFAFNRQFVSVLVEIRRSASVWLWRWYGSLFLTSSASQRII